MPELKIDNLFARRSVRAYTTQAVTPQQIELLLQAAMAAPSAGNRKPWHFIVVTDEAKRRALAESHPHAKMAPQAALVIVPCGEPGLGFPGVNDYWVQDLAAATENILLAAVGLGLGAVWCGVHPREDRVVAVRQALGIPDSVIPFALIAVGYPAEEKEPRTQYDAERVHTNGW